MKTLNFLQQKALSTQFDQNQIETFDVFFEQLGSTVDINNSVEILLGVEVPELQEKIGTTGECKHRFNFELIETSYVKDEVRYSDIYGERLYVYENKEGVQFVAESKYVCETNYGGSYTDYKKVNEQFVGVKLQENYFSSNRKSTGKMTITEWQKHAEEQLTEKNFKF